MFRCVLLRATLQAFALTILNPLENTEFFIARMDPRACHYTENEACSEIDSIFLHS